MNVMIMAMIMGKQHESDAFTFLPASSGASGVFPVLLDTCALFGPLLRDVLIETAWDGMHRPR
jgi:hypothetical protein